MGKQFRAWERDRQFAILSISIVNFCKKGSYMSQECRNACNENVDCVVTWIASLRGLRWKHGAMQVAAANAANTAVLCDPNILLSSFHTKCLQDQHQPILAIHKA